MMNKPIYVTKPYLPPLDEFNEYLKKIWDTGQLTNNGHFHQRLENELAKFLDVPYVSLFANGTLAIITALQALDIRGEVITTPYSFVATTHAIWWNGIKPVFIDIDPITLNLDPVKIEAAITDKTTAILPVHVYGTPCDDKRISAIAKKHNIKLIYDAAHAFNVKENGISVANYGDLSILSFHATKVFSTIEGGAIISHTAEMKRHIDDLKNFGFRDEITVVAPGINAKMNEVQAAFGLVSLKYINNSIEKRKEIAEYYDSKLANIKGISILKRESHIDYNYSYYPIFIDENEYELSRDELYEKLKANNIFSRRYFYPLISDFEPYCKLESANQQNLKIAHKIADSVLCLPIYPDLEVDLIDNFINLI